MLSSTHIYVYIHYSVEVWRFRLPLGASQGKPDICAQQVVWSSVHGAHAPSLLPTQQTAASQGHGEHTRGRKRLALIVPRGCQRVFFWSHTFEYYSVVLKGSKPRLTLFNSIEQG